MIAADWGTGEVLLTVMWFFMFVLWAGMILYVFVDLVRSHDLSGWARALWLFLVIVLPLFGAFAYVVVRGGAAPPSQPMGTQVVPDVIGGRLDT